MKSVFFYLSALAVCAISPALAQDSEPSDYLASPTANYSGRPDQALPVIGLKRKADFVLVQISFSSDSRDATTRIQEIHKMLLAAIDRSKAAGLELATGSPVLVPLTNANYQSVSLGYGGREDTSKADIFAKLPLTGTAEEAGKRVAAFVKDLPRNGRGSIANFTTNTLVVRNPQQYRPAIVKAIAEDVRRNAEIFGPDYRGSIDGLDKPVSWIQLNSTELFLYVPYSYRIMAK